MAQENKDEIVEIDNKLKGPTDLMVTPLLTDLYRFTMDYAYSKNAKHLERAVTTSITLKGAFLIILLLLEGVNSKESMGLQRGEMSLVQIKNFFVRFGYYSDINSNESAQFDAAVTLYQRTHKLDVTGMIDSSTLKHIRRPRCGVPDFINNTIAASHFSFFPRRPKWPSTRMNLTYSFRSTVHVIDVEALQPIIAKAFWQWASVSNFRFRYVRFPKGEKTDIEIGFHRGNHGDSKPFDGPGGVLAHAFAPTAGKFHYDADDKWSLDPSSDEYDLEAVALHEIGHLLGLAHSSVEEVVMHWETDSGVRKRHLRPDDIAGIRTLYKS